LYPRLYPKPEIGKFVPETTFSGDVFLPHIPGAYIKYPLIFFFVQGIDKNRDVIGKMLSVRIYGNGKVKTELVRQFKSFSKCKTLALVMGEMNLSDLRET